MIALVTVVWILVALIGGEPVSKAFSSLEECQQIEAKVTDVMQKDGHGDGDALSTCIPVTMRLVEPEGEKS